MAIQAATHPTCRVLEITHDQAAEGCATSEGSAHLVATQPDTSPASYLLQINLQEAEPKSTLALVT